MRSVSEIAQGAIDALNKYGWIKHEGGTEKTGFCVLGAINYASRKSSGYSSNDIEYEEFKACRDILAKTILPQGIWELAKWNDSTERTKDDVIAALQKVIDNERNNRD